MLLAMRTRLGLTLDNYVNNVFLLKMDFLNLKQGYINARNTYVCVCMFASLSFHQNTCPVQYGN